MCEGGTRFSDGFRGVVFGGRFNFTGRMSGLRPAWGRFGCVLGIVFGRKQKKKNDFDSFLTTKLKTKKISKWYAERCIKKQALLLLSS